MLISWSRDAYGNTTWRIWGIKITIARIVALLVLAAVFGGVSAVTKSANGGTRVDPGCTVTYPVARGDGYCYSR